MNRRKEEGQGLVEYALILLLVAIVVIVIVTVFGSAVTIMYARVLGGFHGQTLSGTGGEAIVLTDAHVSGTATCTVTVPTGTTVVVVQDGAVVKNDAVTLFLEWNGTDLDNIGISTNGYGIAETTGVLTGESLCGDRQVSYRVE